MIVKKPGTIDLDLLSETIDSMNKAENFQIVSRIIFKFIEKFVNFDMAVIYRLNEKEKILQMVSCIGSDIQKMKERLPFKIGESAVGLVAKDKKALMFNDVLKSKEILVRQYQDEDPIIRSFLAVPLIVGDRVIGILSVSSSKPHEYDEYDVQMISIIASQGAVLMELNNNIAEAQNFSNQILENVNSGVIVVNNEYEIQSFNKAAEDITGYSIDQVLGKDIQEIPLKEKVNHWSIIESIENEKMLFEKSGYMIRKDGKKIKIKLSTSLIYDKNKDLKSCICIFRDNTEIEELQKQIAMADKLAALGRLTSGISHEIRNPLLPIRNASEYLSTEYNGENEKILKLLSIIREESERLNRFLGQLTDLNKDTFFSAGECNLVDTLEEVLVLLDYGIKKNNIDLNLDIDCGIVKLPLNEDNMKQIFINLILNAMDAMELNLDYKPRSIDVKIDCKKEDAIIKVRDTGIGMSEHEVNKVFDPFYTSKSDGTGLGLPIIHNLVKNASGKISIESKKDKGTTITLILPVL